MRKQEKVGLDAKPAKYMHPLLGVNYGRTSRPEPPGSIFGGCLCETISSRHPTV